MGAAPPMQVAPRVIAAPPMQVAPRVIAAPPMQAAPVYVTAAQPTTFDAIDRNHDGVITQQEFQQALAPQPLIRQAPPITISAPPVYAAPLVQAAPMYAAPVQASLFD